MQWSPTEDLVVSMLMFKVIFVMERHGFSETLDLEGARDVTMTH